MAKAELDTIETPEYLAHRNAETQALDVQREALEDRIAEMESAIAEARQALMELDNAG